MTPMMSRPLPKALVKKRQEDKQGPKKKKRREVFTMAMIGAMAVFSGVGAMVAYAAFNTSVKQKPKLHKDRKAQIATMLEQGDSWYENERLVKLGRAKKLLAEADKDGMIAGRARQKTSLMEIHLRTLILDPTKKTVDKDGKEIKVELEGGSVKLNKPSRPQPAMTDRKGKLLPGEAAKVHEITSDDIAP